jgi:hypothetical protein
MTLTDAQWENFLTQLGIYGQVRAAAVAADISYGTVYKRAKADPDFKQRMEEAGDRFKGNVRIRTVTMAEKGNPKMQAMLEQVANAEDFPRAQAAVGAGAPTLIINFHGPQRLDELPVAEHVPALSNVIETTHREVEPA